MRKSVTKFATAAAAAALLFSSSPGLAAPSQAPVAPQAQNSWMALSMLSPVGATALGGAAATAAQPAPPPPPADDGLVPPPLPVIAVWLATLAVIVYIATRHDHHHLEIPNSPG